MKKTLTYRLYLLAKPGDERFFVFTRLPNAAWLKTQRENGFELIETIVRMPERYDIDVDACVANAMPETVKTEDGRRSKEMLKSWVYDKVTENQQVGVVTDVSAEGSATFRFDPDPTHAQIGGDHYAKMAIQPEEYIAENDIGYHEGCVIKYVSRWKDKGGLEDLRKARHFLDLKIAREEKKLLKK